MPENGDTKSNIGWMIGVVVAALLGGLAGEVLQLPRIAEKTQSVTGNLEQARKDIAQDLKDSREQRRELERLLLPYLNDTTTNTVKIGDLRQIILLLESRDWEMMQRLTAIENRCKE